MGQALCIDDIDGCCSSRREGKADAASSAAKQLIDSLCRGGQDDTGDLSPSQCRSRIAQIFSKALVFGHMRAEIDNLFRQFDKDGSGVIDIGPELDHMVASLRDQGYKFGRRLTDDDEDSDYERIPPRRIKFQVMDHVKASAAEGKLRRELDIAVFRQWFQEVVCRRRTNLRVLLRSLPFVDTALAKTFAIADSDGSGLVSYSELNAFLAEVAAVLGEPSLAPEEVHFVMRRCDASQDGELDFREFRDVVIEVAARLYHTHFNTSMNIHTKVVSVNSRQVTVLAF